MAGEHGDNASVSTSGSVDEGRGQPAACFNLTSKLEEEDAGLREEDTMVLGPMAAVASCAAPALHP